MKNEKIEINYNVYESENECSDLFRQLIQKAKQASKNAYAPYSDFKVGVALLMGNNEIVTANNQENASYPEGLCAERIAMFYASAMYPSQKIEAIAIASDSLPLIPETFITPCGGCRQVMSEYELKNENKITILMTANTGKILEIKGVEALLPFRFELKQ